MSAAAPSKLAFIEGMRGVAACQVLLLHYAAAFLPGLARIDGAPPGWQHSLGRSCAPLRRGAGALARHALVQRLPAALPDPAQRRLPGVRAARAGRHAARRARRGATLMLALAVAFERLADRRAVAWSRRLLTVPLPAAPRAGPLP